MPRRPPSTKRMVQETIKNNLDSILLDENLDSVTTGVEGLPNIKSSIFSSTNTRGSIYLYISVEYTLFIQKLIFCFIIKLFTFFEPKSKYHPLPPCDAFNI